MRAASRRSSRRCSRPAAEPAELLDYENPESFLDAQTEGRDRLQILGTKEYLNFEVSPKSMSWSNWPYWSSVAMVCRGYAEDDIRKIVGGNFLRVAGSILDKQPHGPLI